MLHELSKLFLTSLILVVGWSQFACGEDDGADTGLDADLADVGRDGGDTGGPDGADANADAGAVDPASLRASFAHDFGPRDLAPGQEVSTCVQWTLDNAQALYVNTVELGNDGGFHHSNWFVVPESYAPGDDGYFDCSGRGFNELGAASEGTVLFAQSTQARTERQAFPEGVVLKIPPRHKIIGSLHLLNLSTQPLQTGLRMGLELIHPRQVEVVVAPFRLSYYDLDIPAQREARFTAECDFDRQHQRVLDRPLDIALYWVLPHYHGLGNYFRLEIAGGPRDGEALIELAGFNAEANGQAFDPPVDLSGASGFRFTCGFDNPRDVPVGWGIGDQEMCVMLGFADSELIFDGMVRSGNAVVGQQDGIVMNEGPCGVLAFPKNAAQSPPTPAEEGGALYVPPTDPGDGGVEPSPDCRDTPADAAPLGPATLSEIRTGIFEASCAYSSCHDAENPAFGLDLTAEDLHGELMSHVVLSATQLPLVAPGQPEGSWLYRIISECEPATASGSAAHMPRNSPTLLDPGLVAMVREWIAAGAPAE